MQLDDHDSVVIAGQIRLAYVTSRYPAVSHSFIQREVAALRARGVEIHTFAIHRSTPDQALTELDRDAAASTYSVLPPRWPSFIAAHLSALLSAPGRYLRTLLLALRLPPGHRGRLRHLFHFAEAVPIWRECRRRRVRHVHAHFTNPSADVAFLVARLSDTSGSDGGWSWSFTAHGTDLLDDSPALLAEKVRSASLVVTVSDFGRAQLMRHVGEGDWHKIRVVRCGIDGRQFAPSARGGSGNGSLRVLTVGRLEPEKGQELLLLAVAELVGRGLSMTLTVVGEGSKRPALERRALELGIADSVELEGAVGQDRIRDFYGSADVFCLPSLGEGVPVVLMEAMAAGLPVVASNLMGIPELVEDQVSGLLVPPGRPDALALAIEELADQDLRRRIGQAARSKVLAEFDLDASARDLLAGLSHAMSEHHRRLIGQR
jgi:glycosyltransferase involved in cell wall biosynthesis